MVLSSFYDEVAAPFSLVSAFVCGIAVITSYAVPQQRKFPNVVLVWTCIGDFAFALYVAMIWLPGPLRYYLVDQLPVRDNLCTLSLYILLVMEESASMLGLLLAFTLYFSVVKSVDISQSNLYYYGYIAIYWIPTICLPLLCFIEPVHVVETGFCELRSKLGTILRILNWFIPLLIQIVLVLKVFHVVQTVTNAVQKDSYNKASSRTFLWLFVRCIGAMANQMIVWLPTTIKEIFAMEQNYPKSLVLICAATPIFLSLNGIIVLAGNKPLRIFLSSFFSKCWYKKAKASKNGTKLMQVTIFSSSSEIINHA
eukprot:Phypoly_transcript_13143.p1 GENE.Phypoly_transcript_13143~~Phypoly_transcript_13143.p1  ORF type:complete len:311 (+),score=15.54 Phypoly_transcript_13143:150-1082(+)